MINDWLERRNNWRQEPRRGLVELLLILVLAGVLYELATVLHLGAAIERWSLWHPGFDPPRILIPAVFLSIVFPLFSFRRWFELRNEIELANTDLLTGLHNRRKFADLMEREFRRARRYNRPLSVFILDIDSFKEVNDEQGHETGDRVLRETARICESNVRHTDWLARWGGDEFVLITPETGPAAAYQVACKLKQAIASYDFGMDRSVSVSVGLTSLDLSDDLDGFLRRADAMLYGAKREGRNRVNPSRAGTGAECAPIPEDHHDANLRPRPPELPG